MEIWFNRIANKELFLKWLNDEKDCFLFSISDSQEIEDVTNWLKLTLGKDSFVIYLDSDSETTSFGLLENIASDMNISLFPFFNDIISRLKKEKPNINIVQNMGIDINSKDKVEFINNKQTVNVYQPNPLVFEHYFLDSKIFEIFNSFLQDVKIISKNRSKYIVLRFTGRGFDTFDTKFKSWFMNFFLKKMQEVGVKIIILSEKYTTSLQGFFNYLNQTQIQQLKFNDILPITKEFLNDENALFCKGILDEKDVVTYTLFKFKLQKALNNI